MNAQAELNKIIGSVTSGIGTAIKANEEFGTAIKTGKPISGIDAKMALKARKVAKQKINAIYENKELYNKARTRRIGKDIDEYNKTIGGGK